MYTIQRVMNIAKKINPELQDYMYGLTFSKSRKNCASMASSTGISRKKLYTFLYTSKKRIREIKEELLNRAKEVSSNCHSLRVLAIDPTSIIKRQSRRIEKVCYDLAGCTKRVEKCMVPIYSAIVISNDLIIPLDLEFWVQKKRMHGSRYKSKEILAQRLIKNAKKSGAVYDIIALDGAFSSASMLQFMKDHKEIFVIRFAKNRKITTDDGICLQVQHHPALKLKRNERKKIIKALYKGDTYFFTVEKRKNKNGKFEVVYLISNLEAPPQKHIKVYSLRWPIEKLIRITKQKFGAAECQALSWLKQKAHILAGFLAYALLEVANNDKEYQSPDEIVCDLRKFDFSYLISLSGTVPKDKQFENGFR
jgi:transcriptional accessory protein Tex/SPT6